MLSKINIRFFSKLRNKNRYNITSKTYEDKVKSDLLKKYCTECGDYVWCNDCKKFISCNKCNVNLFYNKCKKLYCNNTCGGTEIDF